MKKRLYFVGIGILGFIFGGISIGYIKSNSNKKEREMGVKMTKYYFTLNNWIEIKQDNKNLSMYFNTMGYKTVAIYGMKEVGERLYKELKDSEVVVKYAIDQNAEGIYSDVDIYSVDDELPDVDVIVVTPTYYYNSILKNLKDKVKCPIISLDDIIASTKKM